MADTKKAGALYIGAPPAAKYRLTVEISANSHDEIERELDYYVRGGYLLDSDYHKRDTFAVVGGKGIRRLECANPDMTPERYEAELSAWWEHRKVQRKEGAGRG